MLFDFAKAIECIGEAFKSGFSYAETCREHQLETYLIKDIKNHKDAANIAEKAFELVDKYKCFFTKRDLRKYERLLKEFNKED